jgi:hypothetical protein
MMVAPGSEPFEAISSEWEAYWLGRTLPAREGEPGIVVPSFVPGSPLVEELRDRVGGACQTLPYGGSKGRPRHALVLDDSDLLVSIGSLHWLVFRTFAAHRPLLDVLEDRWIPAFWRGVVEREGRIMASEPSRSSGSYRIVVRGAPDVLEAFRAEIWRQTHARPLGRLHRLEDGCELKLAGLRQLPSILDWLYRDAELFDPATEAARRRIAVAGRALPEPTSCYRGVRRDAPSLARPWKVLLTAAGRPAMQDSYASEEAAARAYDRAHLELHGFRVNFPGEEDLAAVAARPVKGLRPNPITPEDLTGRSLAEAPQVLEGAGIQLTRDLAEAKRWEQGGSAYRELERLAPSIGALSFLARVDRTDDGHYTLRLLPGRWLRGRGPLPR